jgi:hypothetical protein
MANHVIKFIVKLSFYPPGCREDVFFLKITRIPINSS